MLLRKFNNPDFRQGFWMGVLFQAATWIFVAAVALAFAR